MTTFSASLPVNMSSLLELSGLFSGTLTPANVVYGPAVISYDVIVTSPVMHVTFLGAFQYSGGNLIGGTMNCIIVAENGAPAYSITGFTASVQTLLQDATASHVMDFFYGLFAGPDKITASSGNNLLLGFGGNDMIVAGTGNDTLNGGPGNDTLVGGPGNDHFVFDTAPGMDNVDTITNFHHGDQIDLSAHLFHWNREHHGHLVTSAFYECDRPKAVEDVPKAINRSQHIIYNDASGALYYNPTGGHMSANGHFVSGHEYLFAVVVGHPELSAHDFTIIA
jgi:Ca2+-binding RTX toxin-like protein